MARASPCGCGRSVLKRKAASGGAILIPGMQKRAVRFTVLLLLLAGLVAACFVLVTIERRSISSVTTVAQGLDDAARAYLWAELDEVARVRWIAFGVIAAIVVIGLSALAPIPEPPSVPGLEVSPSPTLVTSAAVGVPDVPQAPRPRPSPDLTSVAVLCTELSRVATTDVLPGLLGRSAAALDASGLILWVGSGDRLLPVLAHGYPPDTISRLAPVARADDNAAATAWRTGERVIVSGTPASTAAIVIPVLGIESCVGVLAFEVRDGREHDAATHALAAIIAAQLATIVATPSTERATVSGVSGPVESRDESQVQSA